VAHSVEWAVYAASSFSELITLPHFCLYNRRGELLSTCVMYNAVWSSSSSSRLLSVLSSHSVSSVVPRRLLRFPSIGGAKVLPITGRVGRITNTSGLSPLVALYKDLHDQSLVPLVPYPVPLRPKLHLGRLEEVAALDVDPRDRILGNIDHVLPCGGRGR